MKARLSIQDVGGLKGRWEFNLESGKLNLMESRNSGGKTSAVRALVAVLSMPNDGDLGRFAYNEAIKLGIMTDETNLQEGFVNVHSEQGTVRLKTAGRSRSLVIRKNGEFVELPIEGDARFLLAGILSNDTKVLRQLRDVDSEHEPDDFRWAVSELSYASRYDEITQMLKVRKDTVMNTAITVDRKATKRRDLLDKREGLVEKKNALDANLQTMKSKHKEIEEVLSERDKLRKQIAEWTETIGNLRGALSNIRAKFRSLEEDIQKDTSRIERLRKEIEKSKIGKMRESKDKRTREIEEKISTLIQERGELDGILNLLVTAQASMRKERHETQCPLCQDGHISYQNITSRLEGMRKKRDILNGKISSLNLEKHRLSLELQREKDRFKKLKDELGTLLDSKQRIMTSYQQLKASISGDEDKIKKYQDRILKADQNILEISKGIGPEHEKIQENYARLEAEYRETSDSIAVVNQQIKETTVELGGRVITPESARSTLEKWVDALNQLIDFSEQKAEEQRQQAASQFNANIKSMMQRLGFEEFRTVMLNRDYRLYVERLEAKTGKYVFQQVKTLSTSEKLSIALILQTALKETYIPDVSFFVLDDIIEDFDDDRREEVLEYLTEKAKENDWFVVITKLVESPTPLRVRISGG